MNILLTGIVILLFLLLLIFLFYFIVLLVLYKIHANTFNYIETQTESFQDTPIDVVYSWVNTNDKKWIIEKNKYLNENIKYDNNPERLLNTKNPYDEITISIKSVRKNIPWVRNIYVVSPHLLPKKILEQFNVKMVHQDSIFPEGSRLPTFNSVAIETNLHRIPGLSECFIYFNDDMYVNSKLKQTDFFIANKPIFRFVFLFSAILPFISNIKIDLDEYTHHILNSRNLIKSKGMDKFAVNIHQATPLTKTVMKNAEILFPSEWNKARNTRFRTKKLITPVYLALNLGLNTKDVVSLKNDNLSHGMNGFIKNKHDLLCLNDASPEKLKKLEQILNI